MKSNQLALNKCWPNVTDSHVRKVFLISKTRDSKGREVGWRFCSRQCGQML